MFWRIVDKVVEAAGVFAFFASSLFICINVVNRYLVLGFMRDFAKDYEWFRPSYFFIRNLLGSISVTADEVPGLLLVWVAFLGAYLAMRKEGHIAFDLLLESLPTIGKKLLILVNSTLVCGFLLVMFMQSVRMIRVSGATEIETAEIAQGWFMLIMPIAAILLIIATLQRCYQSLRHNPTR